MIDNWVRQAMNMVYEIEDSVSHLHDKEDFKKSDSEDNIEFLKEAVSRMYFEIDSPARQEIRHDPSHCDKQHIVARGFNQPNFELEKII